MNIIQELLVSLGFKTDEASLNSLNTTLTKTSKDINALSEQAIATDVPLNNMNERFLSLKASIMSVTTRLITYAGVVMGAMGVSAKMSDDLGHMAKRSGVSAEKLAAFGYAASQLGGDAGQAREALAGLSKALYDAQFEGNGLAEVMAELGLDLFDDNNELIDPEKAVVDIMDKLSEIDDLAKKNYLIDKAGLGSMTDILLAGSAAVAELEKEHKRLRPRLAESVKVSQNFNDSLNTFWTATKGVGDELAIALLPHMEGLVESLTEGAEKLGKFIRDGELLKFITEHADELYAVVAAIAIVNLKGIIGGFIALGKALGVATVKGAAIGALFLIIHDLIKLFKGEDTIIGGFIDSLIEKFPILEKVVSPIAWVFEKISNFISNFELPAAFTKAIDLAFKLGDKAAGFVSSIFGGDDSGDDDDEKSINDKVEKVSKNITNEIPAEAIANPTLPVQSAVSNNTNNTSNNTNNTNTSNNTTNNTNNYNINVNANNADADGVVRAINNEIFTLQDDLSAGVKG